MLLEAFPFQYVKNKRASLEWRNVVEYAKFLKDY